jgi:exoribonuclease-2
MHCLKKPANSSAGRVMSEAEIHASVQVELDSGKRVKVKAANVLLRSRSRPRPS